MKLLKTARKGKTQKSKAPKDEKTDKFLESLNAVEREILEKATKRAQQWDTKFNICGAHFGWSAIIGLLLPGVGGFLDVLPAITIILMCYSSVSRKVKWKMFGNLGVTFALDFVPVFGDLLAAAWKCNTRNVRLFEKELHMSLKSIENARSN